MLKNNLNEFELIKKFFTKDFMRPDVRVGIGDDGAIVDTRGQELVITTDSLVSEVHFAKDVAPYDLGYKALAVNLSDLAAMGATPAWITMALTLPHIDENWLQEFSRGFFTLAERYETQLIGGDLTHGPLSITISAYGLAPKGQVLLRKGAAADDGIYVTNYLGDAALALQFLQNKISLSETDQKYILPKLLTPEPRVEIGIALRGIASSAIDISDGFAADLQHILEASGVGATIMVDHLPLSPALQKRLTQAQAIDLALNGGDDYELCFTVPKAKAALLAEKLAGLTYYRVGTITQTPKLNLQFSTGKPYHGKISGYQHF